MSDKEIMQVYNEGISAVINLVKEMSAKIDSLTTQITDLKEQNSKQEIRITGLEARLNKNSNNSSKPPSSDGYGKPPQNNRKKSGRLPGGQPGHLGATLTKVDKPDKVLEIKLPVNCSCGHSLSGVKSRRNTRQEFELPNVEIKVTEFVTFETVCPICGMVHKTDFPETITQPVQYGDNMKALMTYLTQYQLLPLERTCEAIHHITGQKVSEGTLVNVAQSLHDVLAAPVEEIKQKVIKSDVVHFDETGMRAEGKTKWMHVASTKDLTYYDIHDKRGEAAAKDIGILPNFEGTAVHDHWKPYYRFSDCAHAECNSHNLRYLKDIVENYKQEWAKSMTELLKELHHRVIELKEAGHTEIQAAEAERWLSRYHAIIEAGVKEDTEKTVPVLNKRGKIKNSKPKQLLRKLQEYDIETLAFMYDFRVPFDNNQAERDVRMQKLRQKISGCFRNTKGASAFCRIRSYISTARKNGIDAMTAITMAIKGIPFIPET